MAAIGTGVIILIVIWLITIIVTLLLLAIPKARYASPLVVLVSVIVTVVLLVYPRGENPETQEEIDTIYFGRLTLLIAMAVFLLGGLGCVTVFHWMTPIHATSHKINYQ
ncbi:transmembrane protein 218-like [Dysidea avara]|uniref:transmembrane protein 218-like n=1 Tax=Dysidea avara TaxID=196820 RepID=UPI00332E208E